jgi:hypothetical protein
MREQRFFLGSWQANREMRTDLTRIWKGISILLTDGMGVGLRKKVVSRMNPKHYLVKLLPGTTSVIRENTESHHEKFSLIYVHIYIYIYIFFFFFCYASMSSL